MNIATAVKHLMRHSRLLALVACLAVAAAPRAQVRIDPGKVPNTQMGQISTDNIRRGNKNQTSSQNTQISDTNHTGIASDTSATKGLLYVKETPDSVLRKKVFFFNHVPHSVKIDALWNPTLDPTGVQFSDPLDAFNGNYYLGMGTIGHPHLSVFPTLANGLQLQLQPTGNDDYLKTPKNVRFYQTFTPYTVLSYNNSLKKDYLVNITHTQNIIPGWNVAFDYRLINPEGNLSGSSAKNHYLDVTTNYFSRDARLQVQAGFIWQSLLMGENGGLTDDSYFSSGQNTNLSGLPVKLYNSNSEHLHHDAFLHATYNFVRQVERLRHRDSLAAHYDTLRLDSIVLVVDTIEVVDTIRVGRPHIINAGVLGIEMNYSRWKRAFFSPSLSDSMLWDNASATLFWTNDAYPDFRWRNPLKITLGITPRRISATVTTDTTVGMESLVAQSVANPFAKVELRLGRLLLKGEGEMDNTLLDLHASIKEPDYHLRGALALAFDSAETRGVELSVAMQHKMPDVRMLHASGYTLSPLLSQRFGLHLFHNSDSGLFRLIDFNASASWMNHNAWYDSTLNIHEGTSSFWLYQASLTLRFQWRWFHVDMLQLLQHSTDKVQMPVPLWASKNSIYADFSLFRNAMRMQIGADLRYYTRFSPDGYDPATGLFYHQDTETGDYIWADAFINLQIKRASIYVKAGHVNALWEKHPNYFLLPHYPGTRFGLLWGMTWNFFD